MVVQLYIGVVDTNKLSVVFGNSHLYIEISGDNEWANFRVVGMGGENAAVELRVDKRYNEGKESAKCANFIVRQKK